MIIHLFAKGSLSVCQRLIFQETPPHFFFLILPAWFCPSCFECVTETFPLDEWPARSRASQRDYGAAAADQVRDGHGHVSWQTSSL